MSDSAPNFSLNEVEKMGPIFIECPNCSQLCEIIKLNCCIFRCGIYKKCLTQIPPHLPKKDCDELKEKDLIFGCGKPFKVIYTENKLISVVCDYI